MLLYSFHPGSDKVAIIDCRRHKFHGVAQFVVAVPLVDFAIPGRDGLDSICGRLLFGQHGNAHELYERWRLGDIPAAVKLSIADNTVPQESTGTRAGIRARLKNILPPPV